MIIYYSNILKQKLNEKYLLNYFQYLLSLQYIIYNIFIYYLLILIILFKIFYIFLDLKVNNN